MLRVAKGNKDLLETWGLWINHVPFEKLLPGCFSRAGALSSADNNIPKYVLLKGCLELGVQFRM